MSALKLFNEKAEKLVNTRFVKHMQETRKLSVTISAKKGEQMEITKILPDQDAIDAFTLTFRFFIQKGEASSFRHLNKAYEELCISQELKNDFLDARKRLNDFLQAGISIKINDKTPSHWDLIRIFIYGGLAHADPRYKKTYDDWRSDPIVYAFLEREFCDTLETILRVILYVTHVNAKAIEKLMKQVETPKQEDLAKRAGQTNIERVKMSELAFKCIKCGFCCRSLFEYTNGVLLGLALLSEEETKIFDQRHIVPHFGIGDEKPTHVISHQLALAVCPQINENNECKIYNMRPLMCRSFPLSPKLSRRIAELKCPQIGRYCREGEICPVEFSEIEEEALQRIEEYLWSCFRRYGTKLWRFDLATKKWVQ